MSGIEPEKRASKKYGYEENDYLNPENVGLYGFRGNQKEGFKIKEVPITAEEGISSKEYADVYEALYDETYFLDYEYLLKDKEGEPEPVE